MYRSISIFGSLIVAFKAEEGLAYNRWDVKGKIPSGKLADILFYKMFKGKI